MSCMPSSVQFDIMIGAIQVYACLHSKCGTKSTLNYGMTAYSLALELTNQAYKQQHVAQFC